MELNGFGLEIISSGGKRFSREGAEYVALPHRSEYRLKLVNNRSVQTDAKVWIDGTHVGTWRLKPYSSSNIERPITENRKFTFVKEKSYEANAGNLITGRSDNGLIRVQFKPEKDSCLDRIIMPSYASATLNLSYDDSCNNSLCRSFGTNTNSYQHNKNYMSGGTVLGQHSDQRFNSILPLKDIDIEHITDLYLRLVVDTEPEFVPLRRTAVPPRIEEHEIWRPWDEWKPVTDTRDRIWPRTMHSKSINQ